MMEKVIITCAITGGVHGKEANPNIPTTPDEQVKAAKEIEEAGASICHIHVRDDEGNPTANISRYNEVIERISNETELITQVGNGIGVIKSVLEGDIETYLEQRMRLTEISPSPDMLTINAGTFESGGRVFPNLEEFNKEFINNAKKHGVEHIECEIYDQSHVYNVIKLVDDGILEKNPNLSIVLGSPEAVMTRIPPTISNVNSFLELMPQNCHWQFIGVGKNQVPAIMMGLIAGGNVRTGLEDNVYIAKAKLAESNAQLVRQTVKLAEMLGREVATPKEAREILFNLTLSD